MNKPYAPAVLEKTVAETDDGQRLDRWLKKLFPTVPFIGLQKMLRQGKVRVNGAKMQGNGRLQAGDVVTLPLHTGTDWTGNGRDAADKTSPYQLTEADMAMLEQATVYEDAALLVLNKPAGLAAQAGGNVVRSLDRILEGAYGKDKAPKLAHRLDRETTGLIVCGKNRTAAAALTAEFAAKTATAGKGKATVEKTYLALVCGTLPAAHGRVEAPLLKDGPFAKVSERGDYALTTWTLVKTVEKGGAYFHILACVPHTGRMNQIRVHMAHVGLPLVGDDKYGQTAVKTAARMLHPMGAVPLYLHAWKLVFPHPVSGERMALEAPLPPHFAAIL